MEGIAPQGAGVVSVLVSVGDCTGNVTVAPAARDGPEKGVSPLKLPPAPRVSTNRQGVMATKVSASGEVALALSLIHI